MPIAAHSVNLLGEPPVFAPDLRSAKRLCGCIVEVALDGGPRLAAPNRLRRELPVNAHFGGTPGAACQGPCSNDSHYQEHGAASRMICAWRASPDLLPRCARPRVARTECRCRLPDLRDERFSGPASCWRAGLAPIKEGQWPSRFRPLPARVVGSIAVSDTFRRESSRCTFLGTFTVTS